MRSSGAIGGAAPSSLARVGAPNTHDIPIIAPVPWASGWAVPQYRPSVTVATHSTGSVARLDKTAAEIFDLFSAAHAAPANTFYVAATGNDTTGTGTSASPWRSIHKAVAAANASGQPARVKVQAGSYPRVNNPSNGGAVRPTVDIAFLAYGGRVITGTFDDFTAPAADATWTATYSFATSNIDRIIDLAQLNRDGFHPDLINVASAAICNRIPGSWALEAGKLYINRADGAPVTRQNTRIFRYSSASWRFDAPCSVFIGGADDISGFDTMGGDPFAILRYQPTIRPATCKAVVVERSSFNYAGGVASASAGANGVTIADLHGLALFVDCDASNNSKDGFSASNGAVTDARTHLVTVNCRSVWLGARMGQGSALSCNAFTLHDSCVGADFAGQFARTGGGAVRTIGASLAWLAGSRIADDRGDALSGGTTPPAAVMANDTAQVWLDRVALTMPPRLALVSTTANAAVRSRGMPALRSVAQGNGLVENW